ncbi:hypothetical protein AVEN_112652-1 [Araneus ventricosus]|uniref:Uncharacterized protein n=1 Tax=Araneus ventricosus TaxID=182803 RepID=A0A4Y2HWC2_ARAVE|nr:hypothetical protein AVEN_112652-1 [Araneus ventricosus]
MKSDFEPVTFHSETERLSPRSSDNQKCQQSSKISRSDFIKMKWGRIVGSRPQDRKVRNPIPPENRHSSARPSPRVRSPTENHEPAQDFQRGSSSPAPYMNYRRTIHAGYNGMAFTPWVTLQGEKTPDVHCPFHPGPPPPPR